LCELEGKEGIYKNLLRASLILRGYSGWTAGKSYHFCARWIYGTHLQGGKHSTKTVCRFFENTASTIEVIHLRIALKKALLCTENWKI
jgi:hypothetical protein